MLQENTFFSRPFIFFGTQEVEELQESAIFSDDLFFVLNPKTNMKRDAGLFIEWFENDESEDI